MVTDEASSDLSMVHWLLWKAQVRLVHFRDPLRRQWNDATNAIKRAALWSTVLLSTIVYNLAYGPWQGTAWWRKLQEGAAEFLAGAQPGDRLLDEFYLDICEDVGEEPYGNEEHKTERCLKSPAELL